MTDDEVCELLRPFSPETIKRNADTGIVTFWDASWIEEGEVRDRFVKWWNAYQATLPPRAPFDLDTYLRSRGIDPDNIVLDFVTSSGVRKYQVLLNGRMQPVE